MYDCGVIIECTHCHSRYQYDEDRFERKPSKKIKCAKCGTVFEIHNPAFAKKVPAAVAEMDSTMAGRPREAPKTQNRPAPPPQESTEQKPLPRDTGKTTTGLQMPAGKRLSLAIIDGSDAGTVFRIDKPRVTIGRGSSDLTLNDSEASREHAAVEIRDTLFVLHDLNSTNGTFVNGQRIAEPVELQDKSEFQVGGSTLMLIVTDEM